MQRYRVQLLAQRGDLSVAPGIGVGDARGDGVTGLVDHHQRGGEGVEADRQYRSRQGGVEHLTQRGAQLLDDLVGVDGGGAVGADGEAVRFLVVALVDLASADVVDGGTRSPRADVETDHERSLGAVARDAETGRHCVLLLVERWMCASSDNRESATSRPGYASPGCSGGSGRELPPGGSTSSWPAHSLRPAALCRRVMEPCDRSAGDGGLLVAGQTPSVLTTHVGAGHPRIEAGASLPLGRPAV